MLTLLLNSDLHGIQEGGVQCRVYFRGLNNLNRVLGYTLL